MSNQDYAPRPERITFRSDYVRSVPGILKIIEFVCDAVALIFGAVATDLYGIVTGYKGFFTFVAAFAIIITTVLFIVSLLNIHNVFMANRWNFIEMVWCVVIAVLFFIASIVVATLAKIVSVYGAAAFFGFAAFITYTADAVNRFRISRTGSSRQNIETHQATTTTTTTRPEPTY